MAVVFLYLNSDKMGEGDPNLGRKLLVAFLRKLEEAETPVDAIGCVNSGVNLTTEKGEAAEILGRFAARGTRIASCGTCLDHFGKREQLVVGEVGDMAGSVAALTTADRIIRPC